MLAVVPGQELLTEGAAVLNTAESTGETGPVLQSAKLTFRVLVAVGNIGPAVHPGNAKAGQRERNGFGAHSFSAADVDG